MGCTIVGNEVPSLGCLQQIFLGGGGSVGIVPTLLGFAAIGLFITLVTGGFKFITSGGNPQQLESAKMTITYAVIGIILIMLSYLIIYLIENLTGANLSEFKIYF